MNEHRNSEMLSMSEPAAPLIELRNVSRHFVSTSVQTRAIQDVSPSIQEGDYVAISGSFGLRQVDVAVDSGILDSPTSGTYLLNKHQVEGFDAYQRAVLRNKEIGFVFQAFNLIGDLTVFENVELPRSTGRSPRASGVTSS